VINTVAVGSVVVGVVVAVDIDFVDVAFVVDVVAVVERQTRELKIGM
jgi:hypothetical protein